MAFQQIVPDAKVSRPKGGISMVRFSVKPVGKGDKRRLRGTITLADSMRKKYFEDNNAEYALAFEGVGEDEGLLRIDITSDAEAMGKIKVALLHRGGARLYLPKSVAAMPAVEFDTLPCQLVSEDEKGFVFKLPLEVWATVAKPANKVEPESAVGAIGRIATEGEKVRAASKGGPVIRTDAPGLVETARKAVARSGGFQPNSEPKVRVARTSVVKAPVTNNDALVFNLNGDVLTGVTATMIRPIAYLRRKGTYVTRIGANQWSIAADAPSDPPRLVNTAEVLRMVNAARVDAGIGPCEEFNLVDETEAAFA